MNPKLFISYSLSSPDHERAVLEIATELREAGIDVLIDKWDLREGHDAHAFMEKMVSDPEIKKVAIMCDRAYVSKANDRKGGVGTETQIITPEIYAKQEQSKFVAVVMERDDDGKPCLPIYYKSRIFIDLSDPSSYATEFEKILRWVYDQPLHKKPDIGQKPAFLLEDERTIRLATSALSRRSIDSLKNGREQAIPATNEYLSQLTAELEKFRITEKIEPFDEQFIKNIEDFIPYRNEAISVFSTIAGYKDSADMNRVLHRFFENLIPYFSKPDGVTQWNEWDFDNFKFIVHELYLYAVACFIKYERFDAAVLLMGDFYIPGRSDHGRDVMAPFTVFREYLRILEHRKNRLKSRRISLHADLIKERCKGVSIDFRALMQADFVLFMRSSVEFDQDSRWWPETLLYIGNYSGAFEVFARSKSATYFEIAKKLLAINSKADLQRVLESFRTEGGRLPRWDHTSFSPEKLLGYDQIATKP